MIIDFLITFEDGTTQSFQMNKVKFKIGRSEPCDLIIDNEHLSSAHCALHLNGELLSVRDLDSKNGTYLNGNNILESYVFIGDEIRIGTAKIRIDSSKMASWDRAKLTYKGKGKREAKNIPFDPEKTYDYICIREFRKK